MNLCEYPDDRRQKKERKVTLKQIFKKKSPAPKPSTKLEQIQRRYKKKTKSKK